MSKGSSPKPFPHQEMSILHARRRFMSHIKKPKHWLTDYNIPLMDWPVNFRDVNPIESLWNVMQSKVEKTDTSSIQKLITLLEVRTKESSTSYLKKLIFFGAKTDERSNTMQASAH